MGLWNKFIEAMKPCEHDWVASDREYCSASRWGKNTEPRDMGVIGYFCSQCGELKVNCFKFENDLQVERDNYIREHKEVF